MASSPDLIVGAPAASGRDPRILGVAVAAVLSLALCWAYLPNLRFLVQKWSTEPNYSHGFVVVPIALAILWRRRDGLKGLRLAPNLLGWVILLAIQAARAYLFARNETWTEAAMLPPTVAALVLALGGWSLLRWAWPGLVFLAFMLPLPGTIDHALAAQLQKVATAGSTVLLRLLALPAVTQGNVILVGTDPLEVARACNGLSMLLSFATMVVAAVLLLPGVRPPWERAVLLLSLPPIALASNILRIVATGWCYHHFGAEFASRIAHDWAGYAMMPVALCLILLELKFLAWLGGPTRPKSEGEDARMPYLPLAR